MMAEERLRLIRLSFCAMSPKKERLLQRLREQLLEKVWDEESFLQLKEKGGFSDKAPISLLHFILRACGHCSLWLLEER